MRVTREGTVKYPFDGAAMVERLHDIALSTTSLPTRRNYTIDGTEWRSPLAKLPSFDLVWCCSPGYMYCVLEGVTQQRTELWLISIGGATYTGNRTTELNERIMKVSSPISEDAAPF
ncbi:hypothetical protein HPB52_011241 [Rhipicephalus sanguineus]|uniref:Uncharacterized protein n=1 Tax=Rhipicephalus sanguineus TaxID=34632 RepID=A0A9D4SUB2_RHISA|nr:hypothetical protein HPB52_011241 [Rhipicephalus sanguineus]